MGSSKILIIHAKDLGLAHSINQATFASFEQRAISSASAIVPSDSFDEVAAYAKCHPDADIGIQLTLRSFSKNCGFRPVAVSDDVPSLLDEAGYFLQDSEEVGRRAQLEEAEHEFRAQIEFAMRSGIIPGRVDIDLPLLWSNLELFRCYAKVAHEYALPFVVSRVLSRDPAVTASLHSDDIVVDRMLGANPRIEARHWSAAYAQMIRNLEPGLSHLNVHLGYDDEELRAVTGPLGDWGAAWRQRDWNVVTSAAFKALIHDSEIRIAAWRDIPGLISGSVKSAKLSISTLLRERPNAVESPQADRSQVPVNVVSSSFVGLPAYARTLRYLSAGRYERDVWEGFEERYSARYIPNRLIPRENYWDGSPLEGRTILLDCEGGLGDALQFMRYVPLVKAAEGRVTAIMQERLVPLFANCPGIDECIPVRRSPHLKLPPHSVGLPIMSFPLVMNTTLVNIPSPYYLPTLDAKKLDAAAQRTGDRDFKIGLSWAGSRNWCSFPLQLCAPLAALAGFRLFGFQRGKAAQELKEIDFPVTNLEQPEGDLVDTAAAMLQMDLIITADTLTCHLAGSLGIKTFTILPKPADWRWMLDRQDTPWFPTMRLFRQVSPGDWTDPIQAVLDALLRGS